jgi:hypothetical protein
MYQPSSRDLDYLAAYLDEGTCANAAEALGVSEQAVKQRLWTMRLKARVVSNQQLIYELHEDLRKRRRSKAA